MENYSKTLSKYFSHADIQNTNNSFLNIIKPVCCIPKIKGKDYLVGSCFFINHQGLYFFITAAHVFDHSKNGTLYIGTRIGPIYLRGRLFTTTNNEDNRIDICIIQIDPIDLNPDITCITDTHTISPESKNSTGIMIAGYPISKNKRLFSTGYTSNFNSTKYYTPYLHSILLKEKINPLPQSTKIFGADNDLHIFIDYDIKSTNNGFSLKGLSGSPILEIHKYRSPIIYHFSDLFTPHIRGMLIEYHSEQKLILGIKIEIIKSMINEFMNYLQSLGHSRILNSQNLDTMENSTKTSSTKPTGHNIHIKIIKSQ